MTTPPTTTMQSTSATEHPQMFPAWWLQLLAVIRLEMKKTFLARRGLWVYLLALAPAVLFLGHSIEVPLHEQRLARMAAGHPVSVDLMHSIQLGATREQLMATLGKPASQQVRFRVMGDRRRTIERDNYRYTDGRTLYIYTVTDREVTDIYHEDPQTLTQDTLIFATIFQYFDLRLAIFFGCVGIFMNLFRGEMLDKSLHYYLLTPMRREVLVLGKYLAGLIATVVIFTTSTALQLWAMMWQFDHATVNTYLQTGGWHHVQVYLAVTALACVGYGTIFLLAGLLFKNPIAPAAGVLIWESLNLFLPARLKQISLIYYLQSLCPVVAPPDDSLPLPVKLLISAIQPASTAHAIAGIAIVSILLLAIAARRARTLEINYSAD